MTRPKTLIPDRVRKPFPIVCSGEIVCGFGRGSAELAIPTANFPMNEQLHSLDTGIYFGWCRLTPNAQKQDGYTASEQGKKVWVNNGRQLCGDELEVLPMVMSIGWNPFYGNEKKTAEVHIMKQFEHNFYGATIAIAVLGYIRPELDYTTKEALIRDIHMDIAIAKEALAMAAYAEEKALVEDESESLASR